MPPFATPMVISRPSDAGSSIKLLVYLTLALSFMVLDHYGHWLDNARRLANHVVQPIWTVASLPGHLTSQIQQQFITKNTLLNENHQLKKDLLIANARLARMQTAAADNAQLRGLLGASSHNQMDVQLTTVLDVDLDPTRQRLVLTSGSREGVFVGQPVIDAGGLMGQIIEVSSFNSTLLLLTDPNHAVPVMIARNGVRLIAYGSGSGLELRNIPLKSEIDIGDEVITSGLGGRFPAGFPVGKVLSLHPNENHTFLVGVLKPAAQLDRGQDVLLLKTTTVPNEPSSDEKTDEKPATSSQSTPSQTTNSQTTSRSQATNSSQLNSRSQTTNGSQVTTTGSSTTNNSPAVRNTPAPSSSPTANSSPTNPSPILRNNPPSDSATSSNGSPILRNNPTPTTTPVVSPTPTDSPTPARSTTPSETSRP